ncbi:MAG: hypothetical protein QXH80_02815 [Candidatus Nanoarchaeia archaeon]
MLDPLIKMNCYMNAFNSNLQSIYAKEADLAKILELIDARLSTKVEEKTLGQLEEIVTDIAYKLSGADKLKSLILIEENKLIEAGTNSTVLDSVRTRREPMLAEYDAFIKRAHRYDTKIEDISEQTHVNLSLILELYFEINSAKENKANLYQKTAEYLKPFSSSQPQ